MQFTFKSELEQDIFSIKQDFDADGNSAPFTFAHMSVIHRGFRYDDCSWLVVTL